MPQQKRKLILITGIPGTGKSTYGKRFASRFGFIHHDLEDPETLTRLCSDPSKWIDGVLKEKGSLVLTWGFMPQEQKKIVMLFQAKGFKVVWFDGNRPAALREFKKRGYPAEYLFHLQMSRIEDSRIVEALKPIIINSFDESGRFKDAAVVLEEIEKADK